MTCFENEGKNVEMITWFFMFEHFDHGCNVETGTYEDQTGTIRTALSRVLTDETNDHNISS